jgi:hypothetical protein
MSAADQSEASHAETALREQERTLPEAQADWLERNYAACSRLLEKAEVELEAQRPLLAALRAWFDAEQAFLLAGGAQGADAADSALDDLKEACSRAWGAAGRREEQE